MKKKTSTIFMQTITCIDHAWVDEFSAIQGGSFLASFEITGNVDPVENVVVDFSTLKGDIKRIIDDKESGLDHKLWVFPRQWTSITPYLEKRKAASEGLSKQMRVRLTNPSVNLDVPENALSLINDLGEYSLETAERIVANLVQKNLSKKYQGILVKCTLSERPDVLEIKDTDSVHAMFRYTHGLKDSTSFGCQNIAHGHLSYAVFHFSKETSEENRVKISQELIGFTRRIGSKVYAKAENVVPMPNNYVRVEYLTEERGSFSAEYFLDLTELVVLPEETTIENLTAGLLKGFTRVNYLRELGVTHVSLSEGLQKGSVISLQELD